jgi:MerR family transcriptional regulator, light-induced transcriptional regulator
MKEYLARGVAAAEAARLAADAETPRSGADTTTPAIPAPETTAAAPPPLQATGHELAGALDRFDEEQTHAVLDRLLAAYRIETILRDLLVPYLHDLGERWAGGEVSVAQEHFASNLLRGRLLGLARGWGQGHGPTAVLACLPGEQHDLGLIAFGITLYRRGWRIIYLGPDTPIATIGQAHRTRPGRPGRHRSRALAAHADAIADLARQTMVALGGAGATPELATRTGAHLLDQDPVSVAEHMDRDLPRSRHTSAPPGPA